LSVIRPWILPSLVILGAGLALDAFLDSLSVDIGTYFGAIVLYSIVCGAYIGYRVSWEEEPSLKLRLFSRMARRGRS
jgi:hypothetical protein